MNKINPSEIIEELFAGTAYLVKSKQYYSTLPDELAPWYCYTTDGGHSLVALIDGQYDNDEDSFLDSLVAIPVKSVLKNYKMFKGYPVALSVEYNATLGLISSPEDEEF